MKGALANSVDHRMQHLFRIYIVCVKYKKNVVGIKLTRPSCIGKGPVQRVEVEQSTWHKWDNVLFSSQKVVIFFFFFPGEKVHCGYTLDVFCQDISSEYAQCIFSLTLSIFSLTLQKHAYSNILKISLPKTLKIFRLKILIFFIFPLKT